MPVEARILLNFKWWQTPCGIIGNEAYRACADCSTAPVNQDQPHSSWYSPSPTRGCARCTLNSGHHPPPAFYPDVLLTSTHQLHSPLLCERPSVLCTQSKALHMAAGLNWSAGNIYFRSALFLWKDKYAKQTTPVLTIQLLGLQVSVQLIF